MLEWTKTVLILESKRLYCSFDLLWQLASERNWIERINLEMQQLSNNSLIFPGENHCFAKLER